MCSVLCLETRVPEKGGVDCVLTAKREGNFYGEFLLNVRPQKIITLLYFLQFNTTFSLYSDSIKYQLSAFWNNHLSSVLCLYSRRCVDNQHSDGANCFCVSLFSAIPGHSQYSEFALCVSYFMTVFL